MIEEPRLITEQYFPENTTPVVSVFDWVYNQKNFIVDSIESILMQKTNFPVEIIIHDDASNDGTKEIILEYQRKYPQLFRNILHDENQWSHGKSLMTPLFDASKGKYIALSHGDDYWTDPLKLQKQIDILDNFPEIQVVYHDVEVIGSKSRKLNYPQGNLGYFSLIDTLQGKQGATLSMVFRKSAIQKINFANFFDDLSIGDWPLECLCMTQGKGYYINETMGCYRMEGLGISNFLNKLSYFDDRQKVAERLLALDISEQNKLIIRSFLSRILLLRLYYNFVSATWSTIGKDISELFRKFTLRPIAAGGMNWQKHFRLTQIILYYPLGFVLGIKNMIFKQISRSRVNQLKVP